MAVIGTKMLLAHDTSSNSTCLYSYGAVKTSPAQTAYRHVEPRPLPIVRYSEDVDTLDVMFVQPGPFSVEYEDGVAPNLLLGYKQGDIVTLTIYRASHNLASLSTTVCHDAPFGLCFGDDVVVDVKPTTEDRAKIHCRSDGKWVRISLDGVAMV